jgi:hypothetical protein
MLKIPKIANSIPLRNALFRPAASESIEESMDFQWNVEAKVAKTMSFSYFLGEGPLYWFRIDWHPSDCSTTCVSTTPVISTTNCQYDINQSCLILPPTCSCTPSCIPGTCISTTTEVWHMMATSVEHLCERINTECCQSKPKGYIRRVRQYMRPALCCDVDKNKGKDEYKDVNFINCECGNLVDPCIARIIYPCDINQCGIHGAIATSPTPSAANLTLNILGHMPTVLSMGVSAMPISALTIVPPKEKIKVEDYVSRTGVSIPFNINCINNMELDKAKVGPINLYYNKTFKSWTGSKIVNDWKVNMEWMLVEQGEVGYKLNLLFDKKLGNKSLKSRMNFIFKNKLVNSKNDFEINLELNNKYSVINSDTVLLSKIVNDDIGVFGKLGKNLKLSFKKG